MLDFPSNSSINQTNSTPINEKTTPISVMRSVLLIANSNDSDNFSLLFSWLLDHRYQILFYSNKMDKEILQFRFQNLDSTSKQHIFEERKLTDNPREDNSGTSIMQRNHPSACQGCQL